jgi:hypothetical protein
MTDEKKFQKETAVVTSWSLSCCLNRWDVLEYNECRHSVTVHPVISNGSCSELTGNQREGLILGMDDDETCEEIKVVSE